MVDYISQEFEFLIENKGYQRHVENLTYVVEKLIYSKGNIKIIFICELMEKSFDFEIWFAHGEEEYCICEWIDKVILQYYGNPGVIRQSIFEYTKGVWDAASFQAEKEKLLHKKYGFGRSKKYFQDSVALYKLLLFPAIERIEEIVNK